MLKFAYISLSLLMLVILYLIGNYAIKKSADNHQQQRNKRRTLILGLVLWQIYISALGISGILTNLSFPPRFVILMILPAFAFIGIFLHKNRKSKWIQSIPAAWLVIYQSFRIIIESLFVYTVAAGLLHKNVTIEGYNYDMVFAFTAPIVALVVFRSKALPKKLLLAWNFLGLGVIAVIITLFVTTIYFPHIYGSEITPFPSDFGLYPYMLVPGFLMPSAVFVHVLSIVQLKNKAQ